MPHDSHARVRADDFEIANDETVINCDRHVGLEAFLIDGIDLDLGDLHNLHSLRCRRDAFQCRHADV